MSESNQNQDIATIINPIHKFKDIPIYCLSIKRYPDKRMYFYSYYSSREVLLCAAFRLSWHLAAHYPIETYKGSQFVIDLFYKFLDYNHQANFYQI